MFSRTKYNYFSFININFSISIFHNTFPSHLLLLEAYPESQPMSLYRPHTLISVTLTCFRVLHLHQKTDNYSLLVKGRIQGH